ncbi:hypothetical protein K2Y00_03890, partial [Patescibacteria group bacterium]|nr:hypothetical protein [Patescibacteria group bacterium]
EGSYYLANSFSTTSANTYINASSTIANPAGGATGNLISWNGSRWVSVATSTLGFYGVGTGSITSAQLANSLTNETGTAGSVVFSASPTFTGTAIFANATLAQATSTQFFATTASSTNLFATNAAFGGTLSVAGLTTLTNASTTNLTVSGNTYFPSGVWNSAGNVGVGTTTPNAPLNVFTAGGTAGLIVEGGAAGGDIAIIRRRAGGGIGAIGFRAVSNNPMVTFNTEDGGNGWFTGVDTVTDRFVIGQGTTSAAVAGSSLNITTGGFVGIGTTTPGARLSVGGDASIGGNITATGTLAVSGATTLASTLNVTGLTTLANASTTNISISGVTGDTLMYANTGKQLASVTLGTGFTLSNGTLSYASTSVNANLLDGLDSTDFLRSNASDSYTSGTLTFDAGTLLDLNTTGLSIADTDIAFDGASTNFTTTGNFSVNTDDLFINKSTGRVGVGTVTPGARLQVGTTPSVINAAQTFFTDSSFMVNATTTNGGTSLAAPETVLTLARNGISGQAYSNFARFDISRYENVGTTARTRLDIRLAHGQGDVELNSTPTILSLQSNGNIGIGTTTPTNPLTVQGNANIFGNLSSANLTATGTLSVSGNTTLTQATSTQFFATTASSTNLFATNAAFGGTLSVSGLTTLSTLSLTAGTTTNFAITGITSSLLKTTAAGTVVPAIAGTDYVAAVTGDWTGTFDGFEGSYYLANSFSTTSANTYINASSTIANPAGGATGNLISWNGSRWVSVATSTLGFYGVGTGSITSAQLANSLTNETGTAGSVVFSASPTFTGTAIFANATLAQATSTQFFATTASSTNLFATNAAFGGTLSVAGLSTLGNTSITNATTTNFAVTGIASTSVLRVSTNATIGTALSIGTTTTSALAQLQLYSNNASGANPAMLLSGNTGGDTDFWLARVNDNDGVDDDSFQIGDGTTPGTNPFLTIDTSGNVGIRSSLVATASTTLTGALLQVGTSTSSGILALTGPGATNDKLGAITFQAGNSYEGARIESNVINGTNGRATLQFYTANALNQALERMRITETGLVGIGTTTPTNPLTVQGNANIFGNLSSANLTATGTLNVTGVTTLTNLTASRLVATDASKNLVSTITLANLIASISDVASSTGTGNMVFSNNPTLVGPNLGTPTVLTLTNATGLPVATGIAGLGANVATFLGTPTSANLANAVTGESGSGAVVFGTFASQAAGDLMSWNGSNWVNVATSTLGFASANQIGSGTIGQVPYYAANGTTLTATSSLFISTNGNVGVGTTNPGQLFSVAASLPLVSLLDTRNTDAWTIGEIQSGIEFRSNDSSGTGLVGTTRTAINNVMENTSAAVGMGFFTGAGVNHVERVRISAAGNFGIGTTTPQTTLSVQGAGSFTGNLSSANLTATGTLSVAGLTTLANASTTNLSISGVTANTLMYANTGKQLASVTLGAGFTLTNGTLTYASSTFSADLLDGLDSTAFLRSNASDSYTSGTLTFDAATALDLNTTSLSIADTDIAFDGASTNFNATGDFSINNADLYVSSTTGYVGLNTSTPTGGMLSIAQSGTSTPGVLAVSIGNTGAGLYGFRNDSNNYLALDTNAGGIWTQRMSISRGSGNVGIGSSTPNARLSVAGAGTGTTINFQTTNSNDVPLFTILDNGAVTAAGATTLSSTLNVTGLTTLGNASSTNLTIANLASTSVLRVSTTSSYGGLATFSAGINVNGETFTDLTGAGLQNSAGVLTLNATGDWTGTFDGFEGSYYLANSFSTTSANTFINASSTIANPNGGATGNLISWNGSRWVSVATSTLGFASANQIGSGTIGQVPYYAADGTTLTATSSLFISTNGNVGVGTTTPGSKFVVSDDLSKITVASNRASVSDEDMYATLAFYAGDISLQGQGEFAKIVAIAESVGAWDNSSSENGATSLGFYTTSVTSGVQSYTEKLRITDFGNLGIGTTTPGSKLTVAGDAYIGGNLTATGTLSVTGNTTLAAATTTNLAVTGLTANRLVTTNGIDTLTSTITLANLIASISDVASSTGTGNMVFSNNPTLVGPNLGTPTVLTLTNATGLPVATGIAGLGANVATFLGTPTSANLANAVTGESGSGAVVFGTFASQAAGDLMSWNGSNWVNVATSTLGLGNGRFTGLADTQASLTANRIIHTNAAGTALTDTAGFVFDGTRMGIGITNPNATLSLGTTIQTIKFAAYESGSTVYGMGVNSGQLTFGAGIAATGTPQMVLTSTGNVGIGTTSPTGNFEIGNSSTASISQYITNSNTGTGAFTQMILRNDYGAGSAAGGLRFLTLGTGFTTSGRYIQDSAVMEATASLSGGLGLATAGAAPIMFYTNGNNERMRIDSAGSVGIGSTTPSALLSVAGTSRFTGASVMDSTLNVTGLTTLGNALITSGTTTNFAITGITSSLLKTTAGGTVVPAIAGTDYVAAVTGDWTGTFDGQEGSYYLANSFSTTSANTYINASSTIA